MNVFEGSSMASESQVAIAEATQGWGDTLDLLVVYCSTSQDAGGIAAALADKYPGVPMVGCSTTGEHLSGKHFRGSVVVAGLADTNVRWSTGTIEGLDELDETVAESCASSMFDHLEVDRNEFDPSDFFCLCFMDGLSAKEESISALMADALDGVALVGGSAGDDLNFKKTEVICDGRAFSGGASFVLAHSKVPFKIIKHQHFTTTAQSIVITKADTASRTVFEIDGYPAAERYSQAIGVDQDKLSGDDSFLNPITLQINGEIYVRSVQSINEDGSLTFYCAVEEGMVLDIGGHHDIDSSLKEQFAQLDKVQFMFGFNCILRALETTSEEKHDDLGCILSEFAHHYIAFDTYGEQLNGLHINQTLVAVAFEQAA